MTGRKASEKTKKKMSESQKARFAKMSEEERQVFRDRLASAQLTPEGRESIKIHMKGNKNGAKYTVEQVKEIRRLNEEGNKSLTEIAQLFGMPRGTVYNIATYRRWKDV